jgi:hypothetical protein
MKKFHAAVLVALMVSPAVPAYAQHVNLMPDVKTRTPEEKEQDAITDKAYRESLKKIPDAKASVDPWGTVRSDAPKAAPAKSRTKTGSNTN